jgi:hypothetical protein
MPLHPGQHCRFLALLLFFGEYSGQKTECDIYNYDSPCAGSPGEIRMADLLKQKAEGAGKTGCM